MNDNQNNSPHLSLFNVLVDEYEHHVRTHGLRPLYVDGAANSDNNRTEAIDARSRQAEEMRAGAEKKRKEVEEQYAPLKDEKERARRVNEELVKDFYRELHKSGEKRAALCFSGGGIRSATFGLGVAQGLASRLDLGKFHFLSTVSGGGYLGSWFSAWAHRRGMEEVQKGLEGKHDDKSPLSPEPEPILHLRRYSNYMSPKLGLLSADTWTLVAIYLRNLFLNWMVLIPLLAVALSLPRLWVSALAWNEPTPGWVNSIFWGGFLSGVFSIAYIIINRPSLAYLIRRGPFRKFIQTLRSEGWFLVFGLGCLVVTAIASALYWLWIRIPVKSPLWLSFFGFEPRNYFNQQEPWGFIAFGVTLQFLGILVSQIFAPQILKKRYLLSALDFIYGVLSGVIGGLFLWMIARAFQHPIITQFGNHLGVAMYACFAPPLFLLAFLGAATVFIGLASFYLNDADREWVGRAGGWILIAIALWTIVNALVIFGPYGLIWLWENYEISQIPLVSTGIGSGIIALLGGRSSATSAKKAEDKKPKKPGLPVKLLELTVPFAAVIFALILIATLSLATTALTEWIYSKLMQEGLVTYLHGALGWLDFFGLLDPNYWKGVEQIPTSTSPWQWHLYVIYVTPNRLAIHLALTFLLIGCAMGIFVNVNKFSLHSAYRDRLIRAYLGASRSASDRRPNPFTGMDEQDNLQMHDLIRPVFRPDSFVNLQKLVAQIVDCKPPYGKFIWSGLSQRTQDLLGKYNEMMGADNGPSISKIEKEVRIALSDNFNRIIHGPPLHKDSDFRKAREELREKGEYSDIQSLIDNQPKIPRLTLNKLPIPKPALVEKLHINAMTLQAAFDGLIAPVPKDLYEARPLHVINMALNLVKGEELAWQDRKAQSFTVSPLHAGSLFEVGYRRSKNYAIGRIRSSAISLGTSMAISGAAASPNMGYHSSPVVTFLMAVFNIRLGWWLGNPGQAGESTHSQPGPVFAPRPLIAESLGRTDNDNPYIYLSDGGHFENLGLYEMVLRRCHFIVVSDGSQDKDFDFESLGNAMSKIRTDMGIRITFDSIPISPREEKIPTFVNINQVDKGKKYCAVGRIHYSDVDEGGADGFLLYIKPAIYGAEPADVQNYARANPAFPHESTGDQMYSETQFESYRALGLHEVSKIAPTVTSKSKIELKEMFKLICQEHLKEPPPKELT